MEEGRAVCPGENLTYTCAILDYSAYPVVVWSGFCANSSDIVIAHGVPAQDSFKCELFSVQATGIVSNCNTSTLTVTASPELNGTVIRCSNQGAEVGRAELLLASTYNPLPRMYGDVGFKLLYAFFL